MNRHSICHIVKNTLDCNFAGWVQSIFRFCVFTILDTFFPINVATGGPTYELTKGDKVEELIKLQRPMPLFNGYHQQFYVSFNDILRPYTVAYVRYRIRA